MLVAHISNQKNVYINIKDNSFVLQRCMADNFSLYAFSLCIFVYFKSQYLNVHNLCCFNVPFSNNFFSSDVKFIKSIRYIFYYIRDTSYHY